MFGQILIWTAFIASLFGLFAFFTALRLTPNAAGGMAPGKDRGIVTPQLRNWLLSARAAHGVAMICLIAAVAFLMNLVLTHQFQYTYVYRYSSRDLPLHYLISAFWAGQEGTFLLWATYSALLGFIATVTVKRFQAGVMTFVMLLQSFLLLILVRLSPFALYPAGSPIPPDGAGLNPLLQDPWMVIHPPMLFLGFASTAIPAAFAMHALARGDSEDWVKGAMPWTAFTVMMLGTPICLGGYWAYKVLGWGGYWGWDPVENGSLVPWLFSVALLHGLVVQSRRGIMKRLNLFLAIGSFMLVLYATFLTRSGVLGDFSVHSFVDLGINGYLIAFLGVYAALTAGLYIWRFRSIKEPSFAKSLLTREYGIFLGSLSLLLFALVVLVGTSAPLITRIGGTPSNVATSYYVYTSIPFGILFCLLITIVPQLVWGRERDKPLYRAFIAPGILGLLSAVLLNYLGVHHIEHLLLVFTAAMAFFANLEIMINIMRKNVLTAGGYLAHVGVGLMMVGIITSTVYSASDSLVLPKGQMQEAFGYRFIWNGSHPIEAGKKEAYDIAVIPEKGKAFTASPVMFFSEYNNGVMRRPAIKRFLVHDLYISPQGIDRDEALDKMVKQEVTLKTGESATAGNLTLKLTGFEPRVMTNARIEIAAILEITKDGKSETVNPVVVATGEGQSYQEVMMADGTKVLMRRVDPKAGQALFYLRTPDSAHYSMPNEAMFLDVSLKPYINVLWLGTFLAIAGLMLTLIRRARNAQRVMAGLSDGEGFVAVAEEPLRVAASPVPVPAKAAASGLPTAP